MGYRLRSDATKSISPRRTHKVLLNSIHSPSLSVMLPPCFRAPAGLRNPFLDRVLHRQGLRLVSWTRRGFDTREHDPQRVLARLTDGLAGGDILLLHDGHAQRADSGKPVVLEVLPRLLQALHAQSLQAVTLADAVPARQVATPQSELTTP